MALEDVLIDELRDIYSAENQLVKALPKLAKGAKHRELKQLFKDHLEETKGHVLRLREVFEHIGKKPTGKHCEGMEGVIGEGAEQLEEDLDDASFDSGLIGAALRTEHYEIAGYNASIAMAKTMGMREVVDLLRQNLEEEIEAAKKISAAAKGIFKEATQEEEEGQGPPDLPRRRRRKTRLPNARARKTSARPLRTSGAREVLQRSRRSPPRKMRKRPAMRRWGTTKRSHQSSVRKRKARPLRSNAVVPFFPNPLSSVRCLRLLRQGPPGTPNRKTSPLLTCTMLECPMGVGPP